ncbi:hypothetical protein BDZ97DRAFT_1759918 [Flammula alnicola]|nr:hypothetical protein BDZ97DRAFT_1759918 [Flammula alnicola]
MASSTSDQLHAQASATEPENSEDTLRCQECSKFRMSCRVLNEIHTSLTSTLLSSGFSSFSDQGDWNRIRRYVQVEAITTLAISADGSELTPTKYSAAIAVDSRAKKILLDFTRIWKIYLYIKLRGNELLAGQWNREQGGPCQQPLMIILEMHATRGRDFGPVAATLNVEQWRDGLASWWWLGFS